MKRRHNFAFLFCVLLTDFRFHGTLGSLPEDLKPQNVFTSNDTKNYAVFNGRAGFGKTTTALEHAQGIKKLGSDYVVYARDNIFVVNPLTKSADSGDIPYKQVFYWPSDNKTVDLCNKKGQTEDQCHNYVKMFEPLNGRDGNRAIACGSNAFNAACKYFERDDSGMLRDLNQDFQGMLNCPYSPDGSIASTVADRNLYTALKAGFSGHDSLIHRSSVAGGNDTNLRTVRGDIAWLNDPRFIRIVDGGERSNKMLIFFTETAVEDNAHRIYSRCGQTCKSDQGGTNDLRSQFTSFFKVTLNCSLPGRPPFYFHEMSDVTSLVTLHMSGGGPRTVRVVFAVMNTPRNSLPGSAICVFTEDDTQVAFGGPFYEQFNDEGRLYWNQQTTYPSPHLARCEGSGQRRHLSKSDQNFAKKHPLMYQRVNAWNTTHQRVARGHDAVPVFTRLRSGVFLTSIDVDAKLSDVTKTLLVTGTEDGKILKIIVHSSDKTTTLLEERSVFNPQKCGQDKVVRKVQIDKDNGLLMVVFKDCVIPAPLCAVNTECKKTCLAANDPHCMWRLGRCTSVTNDYLASSARTSDDDDEGDCPETDVIATGGGGAVGPIGRLGGEEITPVPKNVTTPTNNTGGASGSSHVCPNLASTGWLLPAFLGVLVGVFVCAVVVIFFCCWKVNKKQKNSEADDLALKRMSNGSVRNKRDSRIDSIQSNGRQKSRHPSGGSNGRQIGHRGSVHERQRNPTECSMGNNGDEDQVFAGDHLATPETPNGKEIPDGRLKQLMSTTSSQGGRRKTRNSKQSTSSAPENADDHKRSADDLALAYHHAGSPDGDEMPMRQGSNDSGHASDGFSTPMDPDPYFTSGHKSKPSVVRAMSFQGQRPSNQAFSRTYSMDNARAVTMGHPRSVRAIGRQNSLQVGRTAPQTMYPQGQPYPTMTPQGQPPPTWSQAAPPGAQQGQRYDKRMTHSLDRRQLLKSQNYQLVPSSEVFPEDQVMGPPKVFPSQRKRNVSESAASNVPTHIQMPPYPYQSIQEHEPLLSPLHEEGPHPVEFPPVRQKLTLNLMTPYSNGDAPPQGDFPQTGYYSGPQSGMGLTKSGYEPSMMSPMARHNLRLNIARSNPGTPQVETPPVFGEAPFTPSQVTGNTTIPSAHKLRRLPQQRSAPNDSHQRLSFSMAPVGHSPSKSNPSSPVENEAEPNYLLPNRVRHISGNANQPMPSSPTRPNAPTNFWPTMQNSPLATGPQRGRHFSGPGENARMANGNNNNHSYKGELVKKPSPTSAAPVPTMSGTPS